NGRYEQTVFYAGHGAAPSGNRALGPRIRSPRHPTTHHDDMTMRAYPDRGLHDPASEHDSCGFGLIAKIQGEPERAIVDIALEALSRMAHRGGVAADGLSGDGCGVLIHGAESFVRTLADESGFPMHAGAVAAGMVFLPHDDGDAARCRDTLAAQLQREGVRVAGWRVVPIDLAACGKLARSTVPRIEQVFVEADSSDTAALERALFLARRRSEEALAALPNFYVVGLSPRLLGYKGMVLPSHLRQLFPDLSHPALAARAVVFHQRFSTNTLPRWPLAHPFRRLAHNGEINSIEGNRRWAQARRQVWRSPLLDVSEFESTVTMHGSDSQSLDNMLEWLLLGGMDLPQAMRILIPPATQS